MKSLFIQQRSYQAEKTFFSSQAIDLSLTNVANQDLNGFSSFYKNIYRKFIPTSLSKTAIFMEDKLLKD